MIIALEIQVYGGEHMIQNSDNAIIAADGKAFLSVMISKSATNEVRGFAEDLAGILNRISGAGFKVVVDNGINGIAIGTINDFSEIPFKPVFAINRPDEAQGYEIKSHSGGIYIIGATPQAVGYAVYDFLYRIGYRKFFPTDRWEIIPDKKELEFAAHIREIPDYFIRRIGVAGGSWPEYQAASGKWDTCNRDSGNTLNTGHAYGRIIRENKKIFDQHPEYYGLLNGRRSSNKLCISNPELRKLVIASALSKFEKDQALKSFSVEPSDGGGWCECEECLKMGTPSTRAVTLANSVAEAVRQEFPDRHICMYAYNHHSPPPAIDVDRNVVISVATAYISGGYTLDEILEGWRNKKAIIGIREYYDVYLWSFNLPGKSLGGNLDYLKMTIPKFYNQGARYMTAQSSDNWGADGLGYYLAERMLWNIKENENIDALVQDFLNTSFGPASSVMKEFYKLIDGSKPKPLCSDLLGRMYRLLAQAVKLASGKPDVTGRIYDLSLYTRYCELYLAFTQASGEQKQNAFNQLMEFSSAIKYTRMISCKDLYRENKRIFPSSNEKTPGDWESSIQFTPGQTDKIISEGIAANTLLDFDTVNFSDNLIPPAGLNNEVFKGGQLQPRRATVTYYTWVDEKLQPLKLSVTGGLITYYRNRGNVKCELWKLGGASDTGELETPVQSDASVSPDGTERVVRLTPKQPGLHKIVISDGGDMTKVEWGSGRAMTIFADSANPPVLSGTLCFYVPKNTKILGFFCNMSRGEIISPDGKTAFKFNKMPGYCSIPVGDGMDGKIWKLQDISGNIGFMTIPSYLAITPAGLLLPKEVVEKDNL